MNFSGISKETALGTFLRFFVRFIPHGTVMPVMQGRMKGMRWIVGASNHGCWLGSYEYKKRLLWEKLVTEGSTVFDIGAHVGFYALLSSVLVGSTGRVYAFEPAPRNLFYLREHLRLNCINNVIVIEAAVADRVGSTSFDEGPSSLMGSISPQGRVQVKTVSLDELISDNQLPIPHYVKIDVEGAEMLVLSGAKTMLANAHPSLFLATHGRKTHLQCCKFLEGLGYQLSDIYGVGLQSTNEILACRK